ncbi:uncharacterized protein LOC110454623 [Mizuhopecten yessoensis]|uniref:Uncharacterized protein n=1 Tax=Mizuhopecten yessoensis TaxID=6573 RepID=A0A210QES9_MIZYE|nr:uncharacterized protein LOC110454623 [Mizuhopecten yessoensis]OWF47234.1 hypothetical protein KP79_PYT21980 [Mizuhopecten yessoensis]
MNAVSNKVSGPVIKYTQRTLVRGLQSIAPHNHHITSTTGTPPPSAGMMRAWQTLQEDSWVTTQGHIRPQPLDTFNSMFAEKSILGSRNLGVFEKSSNSENVQSSVKLLLNGFKFD